MNMQQEEWEKRGYNARIVRRAEGLLFPWAVVTEQTSVDCLASIRRRAQGKVFSRDKWTKDQSQEARPSTNFSQTKYHCCIFCKKSRFLGNSLSSFSCHTKSKEI
jgi:hypothetical protein